jgi:hypothetical protein
MNRLPLPKMKKQPSSALVFVAAAEKLYEVLRADSNALDPRVGPALRAYERARASLRTEWLEQHRAEKARPAPRSRKK